MKKKVSLKLRKEMGMKDHLSDESGDRIGDQIEATEDPEDPESYRCHELTCQY